MVEFLNFLEKNAVYVVLSAFLLIAIVVLIIVVSLKKSKKKVQSTEVVEVEEKPLVFEEEDIVEVKAQKIEKTIIEAPIEEEPLMVEPEIEEESLDDIRKRSGFIVIYIDKSGMYRLRIIASNKLTVAHSIGYKNLAIAKRRIAKMIKYAESPIIDTLKGEESKPSTIRFELFKDKEDKFRFRYIDEQENVLLASQGYTTKQNSLNGIVSLRYILNNYTLEDNTKKTV